VFHRVSFFTQNGDFIHELYAGACSCVNAGVCSTGYHVLPKMAISSTNYMRGGTRGFRVYVRERRNRKRYMGVMIRREARPPFAVSFAEL